MPNLEYQFEFDIKRITIKTERMPYYDALDLSEKLGRKGIHYNIIEIDTKCGNYQQITSRMLRMLKRQRDALK